VGFLHTAKLVANRLLGLVNTRIQSLTAERVEEARLRELERAGHFNEPIFPVPPQFTSCNASAIFDQVRSEEPKFAELVRPENAKYPLANDYYTTPDAEVLYAIVQLYRPARIVEIGSGYSTQLFRLAIQNAKLTAHLTSIDPSPRQDVTCYSDQVIKERVEKLPDLTLFKQLAPNDILFIDSSHEIKSGNDVLNLVFNILPVLASGVLIHFHDIFLPYEYPRDWIIENRWPWTEQYLIQAFLTGNSEYEVLWAGHYLQRTRPNFPNCFKHWSNSTARSLWLRKLDRPPP